MTIMISPAVEMTRTERYLPLAAELAAPFSAAFPRQKDDFEAIAFLALAEVDANCSDEEFEARARGLIFSALQRASGRERKVRSEGWTGGELARYRTWRDEDRSGSRRPDAARVLTPGQRRRLRRNICIIACAKAGISQRMIAEVFDLPRSRIGAIVAELTSEK